MRRTSGLEAEEREQGADSEGQAPGRVPVLEQPKLKKVWS